MKLEEAAAILGVHPDTPIETLKQTYRRLALAWHPDKVSRCTDILCSNESCRSFQHHLTPTVT